MLGSGTDALTLALVASEVLRAESGDEVVTAALGSPYIALAIIRAGARPVFADVDPETMLITPASVERVLTPRTRALIPVDLYGVPCDMAGLCELARKHGLAVIEDACQAHGARICTDQWRRVGTFGRATCFSFYPTKNLGCFGDAGAIVSSDEGLIKRARVLRNGGQQGRDYVPVRGFNSRCDEVQAAILNQKLSYLDCWNERRRALARLYVERLNLPGLRWQTVPAGREPVYHLFVIRHRFRDQLQGYLQEREIETMVHYRRALNRQPAFENCQQADCPEAQRAAAELLSLPLYPSLSEIQVEEITNAINGFAD